VLTLTETELAQITHRERPKAQARILRAMGIPFAVHPADGILLVDRGAARAFLGASEAVNDAMPPTVNVEGIRKHGATQRHRRG
jgi:hypothetical protein